MKDFVSKDVENAIRGVTEKLGISLDEKLQKEYQNGKHPGLLMYEKLEKPALEIPCIQKYLIGATTYLKQPCQFYDIYRSCRHVIFIQILNNALNIVIDRVNNYEPRIERLLEESLYDGFESVLYEIVVASVYAKIADVKYVVFLDEKDAKTPELEIILNNDNLFVECKKFNRNSDIVNQIRDTVRDKAKLTLDTFAAMNQSALIEVAFHIDPKVVSEFAIRDACVESFRNRSLIFEKEITVSVKPLNRQKFDEYLLYPSPKYYWERYGYKTNDEWFGITSAMKARFAHHIDVEGVDYEPASTWLDDVDFECALKWKLTDEDIIWKYKRLGYSLIFDGLNQLQAKGQNSVLHVWFERDNSLGHRQNELLDFFYRLWSSQRDIFGWIVFNETILNVSVDGRFDLIEHAHPIRGPGATTEDPFVTGVFSDDKQRIKDGEFGIGNILPDIDEC